MKLSEAAHRHLRYVHEFGTSMPRSSAGYHCRQKGLSEFTFRMVDGSIKRNSEIMAMPKPIPDDCCIDEWVGEVLTDAGLQALDSAE